MEIKEKLSRLVEELRLAPLYEKECRCAKRIAFKSLDPDEKMRLLKLGIVEKMHQEGEILEEAKKILDEDDKRLSKDQKILNQFKIPHESNQSSNRIISDFDNGNLIVPVPDLSKWIAYVFKICKIPPHSTKMRKYLDYFIEVQSCRCALPFYWKHQNLNTLVLLSTLECFRAEDGRNKLRNMLSDEKRDQLINCKKSVLGIVGDLVYKSETDWWIALYNEICMSGRKKIVNLNQFAQNMQCRGIGNIDPLDCLKQTIRRRLNRV